MADYFHATFENWVFTEREPQFNKARERGKWTKAVCSRCGAREDIGMETTAQDLLHRLDNHRCAPASPAAVAQQMRGSAPNPGPRSDRG